MINREALLFIVDTNVPIVANGKSHMSERCVINCVNKIREIVNYGTIVIDDKYKIIKEYRRKLHQSGQPGVGDAFLKWVLTYQGNPSKCNIVPITPINENHFKEFPSHPSLEGFDKSDRKFVAVANSHNEKPPILQASDRDWLNFEGALNDCGIKVIFLCRDELE